jgi:MarR family 2-MHQ and catechol resistance regulon transcriptional repressor
MKMISNNQKKALSTYVKLMRSANCITEKLHLHLKDSGLTVSQFAVLEVLMNLGPMCQQEIGKKILKTSGNMTMVIDNLEKRGLVKRKRDLHDRRYVRIELTPLGQNLIAEIFPNHASIAEKVFGVLDSSEINQLGFLLTKIGKHAAEKDRLREDC